MIKRSLSLINLFILATLILTTGCEEVEHHLDVNIQVTSIADKVTVTLSKKINSITMPNTIELETGTYSFDIFKDDERVGNYGLLAKDDYSFTIALLGFTPTLAEDAYEFRIYSGSESDPILSVEKKVTFPAWSTTARYIDIFDTDVILLQMVTSLDTDPVLATETFAKSDFTVFDGLGNNLPFTFESFAYSEPYPSEYELVFSGLGKFWIRFYRSGFKPVSTHINR